MPATFASAPVNHCRLHAALAEKQALRYTPAGVPALNCVLEHTSQLQEAGQARKVAARVKAVALGMVAEQLDAQALGIQARFEGFLASPASRHRADAATPSTALVLHIQAFSPAVDS